MTHIEGEDSVLIQTSQRFPIEVEKGNGATIWDTSGREYIDCMGGYGVGLIGHSNKKVIAAIEEQLRKIMVCHMSL
jgi:acetylornithine/LysW-gamma-L-lysine aminotransferase